MYLNLDLLYNTYKYLFPLFYYKRKYDNVSECEVYSPMTKKTVFFLNSCSYYIDNTNHKNIYSKIYFTKEYIYWFDNKYYQTSPFKINKEVTSYLKNKS